MATTTSRPRRQSRASLQRAPELPADRPERIQKLLAAAGLGSRREIEAWIEARRVGLNGQVARLGDKASYCDALTLDGRALQLNPQRAARVLLYHKPVGELVTRNDRQGRPTVFAALPPLSGGKWIAVGRLDANTSGLLLLTDSGELAHRLMHPRFGLTREYEARVQGRLSDADRRRLVESVDLDDGPARFETLELARPAAGGSNVWYRVTIGEGRNREVRRLFAAVGSRVSRLVRRRYGPVALPPDLPAGRWRELGPPQVAALQGLSGEARI